MKKYRLSGVLLSLLFMVLFLGALGLRIWASDKSTQTVGPDHIAVGQDRVYVHVNGELFVLSAQGKTLERKRIEPLIQDNSLIDLRVMQDGRLLLAKQQPAGVNLCDPVGWQCTPVGKSATAKVRAQFKALVDESSNRMFIADFAANRVWLQSLADGEAHPLDTKTSLNYLNDIALDPSGRLWVADSGHRRIVALERKEDGAWEEARSFDARNRLAREGRDWPMMLAMAPDGNWWVTQPTSLGGQGDLLVYHPENGVQSRIELPGDAYPTDVASAGTAMLVTDMDRFKIYQVDVSTHAVSEFGDAAFRQEMSQAAERKGRYLAYVDQSVIGMVAFGILMIVAAFWASPKEERRLVPPPAAVLKASDAPAPSLKEIYWLRRHPKTERILRWQKPLAYMVPLVMIAMTGAMYFVFIGAADTSSLTPEKLAKMDQIKMMLLVMAFFTASLPILVNTAMRNLNHRLGTDGQRLFIKLATGRQISLAPEQLVYSARQLAYQAYVFPIQTGKGQPLYDDGEINTYIAPLLVRARKLGAWEMFRYQLAQREPTLVTNMIFVIMLTAMMLATGMWRQLLPHLG